MKTTRFNIGDFEVLAVPTLQGTYNTFSYLLCRDGKAVLIDAGEAKPIFQTLEKESLQLVELLITHTHNDHVGGCRAIQDRLGVQSVSPGVEARERTILGTICRSISTPGHVAVHKCYHFSELNILFSGDTIINGGCGRIMGGTPEQYFEGLGKIKTLSDNTLIFGGHDYLTDNMNYGLSAEPGNTDMQARLDLYASDPADAIFATLAEEKKTNPFLRVDSVEAFFELRRRKDSF
ncbi:MAG: MBL fold metallo-hydrolase [Pontiella sp.]